MNFAELDDFWRETLAQLALQPVEAEEEQVTEPLPHLKYRITYRSLDGVGICAYLGKPVPQAGGPARLPAIISAPGYGGREQSVMLHECQRGYIVLQIFPRGQGDSDELWSLDGADKLTGHLATPHGNYYRGCYSDIVRGIDYLTSRPDVDPDRIGIIGTSQAGAIALATAALDHRIKAVVAHVPFLCDMRRAAHIEGSLVRSLLSAVPEAERNFDTLDLFDPLNLAPRITVPALLSAGGKDTLCPAETIRAVFDRIQGIKSLSYYPDLVHTSSMDFYGMTWEWMARYLK